MTEHTPTTERLAQALQEAGAPDQMVQAAKSGYYDDYKSPLGAPIAQLVADTTRLRLFSIAERAKNGEFDAQQWEGDLWIKSKEGQAALREFEPLLRRTPLSRSKWGKRV